ncbi:MAG: hypothetical protein AAFQ64_01785 [Pseudomonadota bacterium]
MSDITDVSSLEARINDALGRIETGLGAMADVAGADLGTQLDEEREANAQLEERVKALKARQDNQIAELEAQVKAYADQLTALDAEMQRLRASNADLRDVGAQLRAAASDGTASPELINRAMMAEVEALTAQRAAEAAEVDAVLSTLKPLLAENN